MKDRTCTRSSVAKLFSDYWLPSLTAINQIFIIYYYETSRALTRSCKSKNLGVNVGRLSQPMTVFRQLMLGVSMTSDNFSRNHPLSIRTTWNDSRCPIVTF